MTHTIDQERLKQWEDAAAEKRRKTCSCCGEHAGKWKQWHNRDLGFGVCGRCAEEIMSGRIGRGMERVEFERLYGFEGKHWGIGQND